MRHRGHYSRRSGWVPRAGRWGRLRGGLWAAFGWLQCRRVLSHGRWCMRGAERCDLRGRPRRTRFQPVSPARSRSVHRLSRRRPPLYQQGLRSCAWLTDFRVGPTETCLLKSGRSWTEVTRIAAGHRSRTRPGRGEQAPCPRRSRPRPRAAGRASQPCAGPRPSPAPSCSIRGGDTG